MKKILVIMFTLSVGGVVFAQSYGEDQINTILGDEYPVSHGGYGALTLKYGKILDQDAWFAGLRGGWLIDHRLTLGLSGAGLINRVTNDDWLPEDSDPNTDARLFTGYGGLLLEPIIFHKQQFHISIPITIGAGAATYGLQDSDFWGHPDIDFEKNGEVFFAFEPGLELEINVVRFMRINIGGSYLYTSDILMPSVDPNFMRGFMGSFAIKFGSF
jgi:hypothetical protein